jgi:hypothetical protein
MSGAARSWPGMSPNGKRPRSLLISSAEPACACGSPKAGPSFWTSIPITITPCGPPAGEPPGGAGSAQILFQAEGEQRQPLLGVSVPDGEIPARLPTASIPQRGRGLTVGDGVRRLLQPPAPPQRHPVRDARPAAQRPGHCHRPPTGRWLRTGTPAAPTTLEAQHSLLAAARGGMDQSSTS